MPAAMLPNEMVLAPLQKLKIKYIDKFDQLLITPQ